MRHYLKSIGNKSKNDKIDARGLAQMGLDRIAEATVFTSLATPIQKHLRITHANPPASTVTGIESDRRSEINLSIKNTRLCIVKQSMSLS